MKSGHKVLADSGLVLILILFWLFLPVALQPAERIINNSQAPEVSSEASIPTHLEIPKINVDASLESVGLNSLQEVGVPKDIANAAWFNLSPAPGDTGNSVITGHFGWKNGVATVFNNLHKLQKGDQICVEDEKGKTSVFVVRELRSFQKDDIVRDVFVSSDGAAHLNLITCEGDWDSQQKSYSNRLVVFTDEVTQK